MPTCGARKCGEDGCGGSCGACAEPTPLCDAGICVAPCQPACDGLACGDDGCGGSCGACGSGMACEDGACVAHCEPLCANRECGDDGCGGNCGYCTAAAPVCSDGTCLDYCPTCKVSGTVTAPEGSIPVAGALVYLTTTPPEPIPDHVFCDTCIDLPKGTPFAYTAPDGGFQVGALAEGHWTLVIEKGPFRRVLTLDVTAAGVELPGKATRLPGASDPATGDHVPRMVVVADSYDEIENTLAKLGLGVADSWGELEPGSESFDLVDFYDAEAFFSSWANLQQYHIIFMPCDSDWFSTALESPEVKDTLRKYVQMGGRLYVTDWSYDILKALFPQPITWLFDDGSEGSAQLSSSYDAPAQIIDPGLYNWLAAQNLTAFDLEASWTIIEDVHPYTAPDLDGKMVEMKPHVWLNVAHPQHGSRVATVSFQYGCGRGLFSGYHTEAGSSLLPQEKVLTYILLQVAVCTETKYHP